MNNDKQQAADFEERVKADLTAFLQKKGALDSHVPECPDVEDKWSVIARAYLPDGAREFSQYPVVSLGWMMLTGMAAAYFWDTDWEKYAPRRSEEHTSELQSRIRRLLHRSSPSAISRRYGHGAQCPRLSYDASSWRRAG